MVNGFWSERHIIFVKYKRVDVDAVLFLRHNVVVAHACTFEEVGQLAVLYFNDHSQVMRGAVTYETAALEFGIAAMAGEFFAESREG